MPSTALKPLMRTFFFVLLAGGIMFAFRSGQPTPAQAAASEDPTGFFWRIEFPLAGDMPAEAAGDELAQAISDPQVQVDVAGKDEQAVASIWGSKDLQQFKDVVYSQLAPRFGLLQGGTLLSITGRVSPGQEFEIVLESNPSTGYSWAVTGGSQAVVAVVEEAKFIQQSDRLGAAAHQVVRLRGLSESEATLELVYRRPFEQAAPIKNKVTIVTSEQLSALDLSDPAVPEPVEPQPADEKPAVGPQSPEERPAVGPQPPEERPAAELPLTGEKPARDGAMPEWPQSTPALPASFDWHTQGVLPAIKDQGQCGTCWSFGVVGVMEAALKIANSAETILSEQYLVSCNTDGFSSNCNVGGNATAHDYHLSKVGKLSNPAGAVLNSDFPYTSGGGTIPACRYLSGHANKIAYWDYVPSTVESIKQAIYAHGPVFTAICAGSAFQGYGGGVFSTNESGSCGGGVNHAVILTGWDDSTQTWILRNSWGTYWGESGYMHIRWGTSNVGWGTNLVLLQMPADSYEPDNSAAQAKAISSGLTQARSIVPVGDIDWATFTLPTESAVTIQTSGLFSADTRLWLYNSSMTQVEYNDDYGSDYYSFIDRLCGVDALPAGTYYVKVDEYGGNDTIADYNLAFQVTQPCGAVPGDFAKLSPGNGASGVSTSPTLGWEASSGAVGYEYCYDTTNNNACDGSWISASTSTSAALFDLAGHTTYYWQVQALNNLGATAADGGSWWSFSTQNPLPSLTLLDPASISAGETAFSLSIYGANFIAGVSTARWNDSDRATTVISSTLLQAAISAEDIAAPGSAEIAVFNAAPGGGTSNTQTFTIMPDATPPTGTVIINGGASYTGSPTVTLALSASDNQGGALQMRFSNDGAAWSEWESYASSRGWALAGGDGQKTVSVQYKDEAGNVSAAYSDTIILDTLPPTGTVSINGGALYSGSPTVTLALAATDAGAGVLQMRLSNNGTSWTAWEAYAAGRGWALTPGDGLKTVYVQFKDRVGRISAVFNRSITLDTIAPTGTVIINGGASYSGSPAVTLALTAADSGSGVQQMHFSNNGTDWSDWEAFAASKSWTLAAGDGQKTVSVQFADGAGNVSAVYNDTIILDTLPPSGAVSINGGEAYTAGPTVTLALAAADAGAGVLQMRLSNNGSAWSAWEAYADSRGWALTAGDGQKTVYVQFKDKVGRISAAFTDTIILDTLPPSGSIVINGGASYSGSPTVTLALSTADAGAGVGQVRFSNNGTDWSDWEAYAASKTWALLAGDGLKTVYVQYKDRCEHISGTYSDTITLDTQPPGGTIVINNGAAYTVSPTVTLALSAADAGAGVLQMRFSNNGSTWSAWESYAASKSWSLTAGNGLKTVYVQYKDKVGRVSAAVNDTITLSAAF